MCNYAHTFQVRQAPSTKNQNKSGFFVEFKFNVIISALSAMTDPAFPVASSNDPSYENLS
ncbi:hypothetical protein GCM10011450_09920 [Advenella faeciporci]|uniref:Uncharacterized protein n=1 Tax=Advenella faeciporci TaxID=797535 RepID=A0A918MWV6_9BURK|nr:hypothetical protein GCM10011450_09920 [Advenella faeciporci]